MIVKTTTKTTAIIPTNFNTPHIVQKTVHLDYESYLKVLVKGEGYLRRNGSLCNATRRLAVR